ncbi:MAG: hypothetical protein AAFN65_12530, partial [Bacteroidota bacterium]
MKQINWRYALGEVLIVILGISIAFSLNNWKEQRADNQLRNQYLMALQSEIEDESADLDSMGTFMSDRAQLIGFMGYALLNPNIPSRDSVLGYLFEVAEGPIYHETDVTYQTLVNSGDLRLINDLDLRKSIEAHYSTHDQIKRSFFRLDNIYADYLGKYFVEEIDYMGVRANDFSSIENSYFQNILYSMAGAFQFGAKSIDRCAASNARLLKDLQ